MFDRQEKIGFALAPVPFVAPLALMFGISMVRAPSDSESALNALLQLIAMAYGATLAIGVPVHLALRRKQSSGLLAYLGFTIFVVLALGVVMALVEQVLPRAPNDNPFQFRMWSRTGLTLTLAVAAAASVSACVFWRVAVRPRKL